MKTWKKPIYFPHNWKNNGSWDIYIHVCLVYQQCNDLTEIPIQHVSSITPLCPVKVMKMNCGRPLMKISLRLLIGREMWRRCRSAALSQTVNDHCWGRHLIGENPAKVPQQRPAGTHMLHTCARFIQDETPRGGWNVCAWCVSDVGRLIPTHFDIRADGSLLRLLTDTLIKYVRSKCWSCCLRDEQPKKRRFLKARTKRMFLSWSTCSVRSQRNMMTSSFPWGTRGMIGLDRTLLIPNWKITDVCTR